MNQLILRKPIITERSIAQTKKGFYTFAVDRDARKEVIKRAVEKQFLVNVVSIRTIKMPEKTRRIGKSMRTATSSSWKKAIVKLKKDQKISVFDVAK